MTYRGIEYDIEPQDGGYSFYIWIPNAVSGWKETRQEAINEAKRQIELFFVIAASLRGA